jgi:AcrR family transcriptional regulator
MVRTAGLGPASRSTGQRRQTRDLVLDAALRLFTEHGYLGVRVEDIAKEAGVSRATFYKHFIEREQVLAELFERLLGAEAGPEQLLDSSGSGSGSTEQQVTALVEEAVRRMVGQEHLARFVYSLPVRHSALLRPGALSVPPVFGRVSALLERGAERGEVRHDVPLPLLTRQVLDALETAMRVWAEGHAQDPIEHVRLILGLTFSGVTSR